MLKFECRIGGFETRVFTTYLFVFSQHCASSGEAGPQTCITTCTYVCDLNFCPLADLDRRTGQAVGKGQGSLLPRRHNTHQRESDLVSNQWERWWSVDISHTRCVPLVRAISLLINALSSGVHYLATRNMDEALRSFDSVLALKPTNLIALLGKVSTEPSSRFFTCNEQRSQG